MRVYLFFICLISFSAQLFAESEDESLKTSVEKYQSVQKELDELLRLKTADCAPGTKLDPSRTYCSVKDFCSRSEVHIDEPILYQNDKGEKIINEQYYQTRGDVRSCLQEKYVDEFKAMREELTTKLRTNHLKKIIAANRELTRLADKFHQGSNIQKISAEILTMSVELGMSGVISDWEKDRATRVDLASLLSKAQQRTKLSLHPKIKETLIEIQYLKQNHLYNDEVAEVEREWVPEVKIKDPFFEWELLKDEKAAGGKEALALNRARLVNKTQEAYYLFQDVQKDMISYLESKKNEKNLKNIERIIERIKTIRFNPPRLTDKVYQKCKFPNAYYSGANHSFTICPQMLDFPKIVLREAIAHEIPHSYDSCYFSGKMYKTNGPSVVSEAPFEIDIKMNTVVGNYKITLDEDPEGLELKNIIQDKALYIDHPFSTTLSCLQDTKSVAAQSMELETIKIKTDEALAKLSDLGENNSHNKKARVINFLESNQKDFFAYFQGCHLDGNTLARTQMQEVLSDKISSEMVVEKLKSLPKEEVEKAILEIGLSYGDLCTNEGNDSAKFRAFAISEKCPKYFENKILEDKIVAGLEAMAPAFEPHPETSIRINRNLLAHPAIRKVLKCPDDSKVKYCE